MRCAFGILLVVGACSSPHESGFPSGEQTQGSTGGVGTIGSFNTDGGVPADDCAAEARLVYVVTAQDDLYSFMPSTTTFTKIGRLACPVVGTSPNSMAIDRAGTAWVNYSDGALFKVSTKDASCTPTPFEKGQSKNFVRFGMAFATNGPNTTDETLYISGLDERAGIGFGLGKIDLKTFKQTSIGDYSGSLRGQGAELSGTGDGRLFGFFTTAPATLAEIDKASGSTSKDKPLTGVSTGNAWAFAFWGGDFWFFTATSSSPSTLTRLKTSSSGEIAVVTTDVGGFRVVGAAVSTCAPTTPPR
jgi:hypothetical protein